jgi:hypothetical protein
VCAVLAQQLREAWLEVLLVGEVGQEVVRLMTIQIREHLHHQGLHRWSFLRPCHRFKSQGGESARDLLGSIGGLHQQHHRAREGRELNIIRYGVWINLSSVSHPGGTDRRLKINKRQCEDVYIILIYLKISIELRKVSGHRFLDVSILK